jgi:hypothetical protein
MMPTMTAKPCPMPVTVRPDAAAANLPAEGRDPAHALYEQAAGMLASAGALRAAAHTPGTAAALGPTLACLEAALDALADVADRLRNQAGPPDVETRASRREATPIESEVEQRFRQLVDSLESSRLACAYARLAVGPVQSCARHTLSQRP